MITALTIALLCLLATAQKYKNYNEYENYGVDFDKKSYDLNEFDRNDLTEPHQTHDYNNLNYDRSKENHYLFNEDKEVDRNKINFFNKPNNELFDSNHQQKKDTKNNNKMKIFFNEHHFFIRQNTPNNEFPNEQHNRHYNKHNNKYMDNIFFLTETHNQNKKSNKPIKSFNFFNEHQIHNIEYKPNNKRHNCNYFFLINKKIFLDDFEIFKYIHKLPCHSDVYDKIKASLFPNSCNFIILFNFFMLIIINKQRILNFCFLR